MSKDTQITPPPVMWAERTGQLYVTFCLEDCVDPIIKVEPEQIYFKGIGGTERKEHEVTINLFHPIDPTKVTKNAKGRLFELVLAKKDEGPYWKRLTKDNEKHHWLKCDFNKWKDEDDSDDDSMSSGQPQDLEKAIRNMSYLNNPGDAKPNFDLDMPSDSDDDELPGLE